jgi:hypothetical protein
MADGPFFLSATHRLANFQFESSDALLNRPRDEQNCEHKRDSATGYGEDHKVMVCKKHGVPSDARYGGKGCRGALQRQRRCLVPKCDGRSSEPAATWAFLPRVLKPVHDPSMSERIRGVLCSLSDIRSSENSSWRHVCPMSNDHERNEFGLLLGQFHAVVRGGSDSIEGIFDAEFRRRFSELINRVAELDRPDPADLRKFHQ